MKIWETAGVFAQRSRMVPRLMQMFSWGPMESGHRYVRSFTALEMEQEDLLLQALQEELLMMQKQENLPERRSELLPKPTDVILASRATQPSHHIAHQTLRMCHTRYCSARKSILCQLMEEERDNSGLRLSVNQQVVSILSRRQRIQPPNSPDFGRSLPHLGVEVMLMETNGILSLLSSSMPRPKMTLNGGTSMMELHFSRRLIHSVSLALGLKVLSHSVVMRVTL
mmetsp:Transcript_6423/g.8684  ORF Transcript_6423/g.8684 Transcript_6423/m.8684 type:complete len:226 (-) Transcript_6423:530-1207(-)